MKVIFLGSISLNRNRLDGVTVKSRALYEWLMDQDGISVTLIDTDNWSKNFIKISISILMNIFKAEKIVICSAQRGANIFLKVMKILNIKAEVYYFVAGGRFGNYIKERLYDINVYRNLKRIYVESDIMLEQLKISGLKNVEKIWNFRKIQFDAPIISRDNIKFVFFSRVIKEKGIEDLIYAFNILKAKYPNIILDIYGQVEDEYLEKLKNIMNNGIEYKGVITPNNIQEYELLSQYDVFVLPTYYKGECLPGALIDAYISGLAIVASDWKYAREYINDGEVGYIYKYMDKNDLVCKMEKLILEKDLLLKFKMNSKKQGRKFNSDEVLKSFKINLIK